MTEEEIIVLCPYCKSMDIIKRGSRETKRGITQMFGCKSCKKRFVKKPYDALENRVVIVDRKGNRRDSFPDTTEILVNIHNLLAELLQIQKEILQGIKGGEHR